MKQIVLSIFFLLFTFAAFAKSSPASIGDDPGPQPKQTKVSVYPNPATSFISVNQADNVKQIAIFNLVGRKLKSFEDIVKDQQYDVSDLPNGMYLVQVIDNSNKIITTQRISKR
jgi:hypothetical protein